MSSPPPPDLESALRHVKPAVRELAAYTLGVYEPRIKLNQNESPYDVPEELKSAIQARLAERPWNRYPPFVARDFIEAVARSTGWDADGVLVGNGSNELIQALLAVVAGPGTAVVIPEPTFTLYRLLSEVMGAAVAAVPLAEDLRFDVDAIVGRARETDAAAVILCTPNNPTGSVLAREEILRVHDQTGALVVLDQAYVEFGGYDAIPLLAGRPRLVILRTFSKAMAMAGLRAGYLLAHPDLAAEIGKAKLPYNVNFFTEVAAAEVLRRPDLLAERVERIRTERERLYHGLAEIPGMRPFPSGANFVLFRVEHPRLTHESVFRRLLDEHGILVRDVSRYPMLNGCLRVNAGTREETSEFLRALREILTTDEP